MFKDPTIYSTPLAIQKKGDMLKFPNVKMYGVKLNWENIKVGLKRRICGKVLISDFDAQNLSNKKYQTAFAKGSTIASVRAIIKETSAINIKTVMAIAKWPIV